MNKSMTIRLRFFGPLGDLFKATEENFSCTEGKTASEILDLLLAQTGLSEVRQMPLRFAVNDEFAAATVVLKQGDTLALLPPVSGG